MRQEITAETAQVYDAAEERLIATVEAKPGVWDGLSEAARVAAAQPGVLAVENNLTVMKFPKW